MPRPRPRAVVRLTAKIETSVRLPRTDRIASPPKIPTTPTTSGSNAATTPPKATTSSTIVIGMASDSATARSEVTWSLMFSPMVAKPPGVTVTGPGASAARSYRLTSFAATSSSSTEASTRACLPLSERRGGPPTSQYETTLPTPGSAASVRATSFPAAVASGASTAPARAVTRRTRFGWPPKRSSTAWSARVESDRGSSNPPVCSLPNAPTPTTAVAPTSSRVTSRTSLGRRVTRRARLANTRTSGELSSFWRTVFAYTRRSQDTPSKKLTVFT